MTISKSISTLSSVLLLLAASTWANENSTELTAASDTAALGAHCTYSRTTPIIPDGNIATKDELVSAQTRVKAYQEQLLDFRECLLEVENALDTEAEGFAEKKAALAARANSSIDLENTVADEFNEAIRIYKTR